MSEFKPSRGRGDGGGSSGGRRWAGRPPREEGADALLDIADDLEEQARDLLRRARQLQRMAERMAQTDSGPATRPPRRDRPERPDRPERGGRERGERSSAERRSGERGERSFAERGSGERGERRDRGRREERGESRDADRKPRRRDAGAPRGEGRPEHPTDGEWQSVSDRRPKRSTRGTDGPPDWAPKKRK